MLYDDGRRNIFDLDSGEAERDLPLRKEVKGSVRHKLRLLCFLFVVWDGRWHELLLGNWLLEIGKEEKS